MLSNLQALVLLGTYTLSCILWQGAAEKTGSNIIASLNEEILVKPVSESIFEDEGYSGRDLGRKKTGRTGGGGRTGGARAGNTRGGRRGGKRHGNSYNYNYGPSKNKGKKRLY